LGLINAGLTGLFDLLLWPFRGLAPVWGLFALSAVVGVLLMWVFGKTSNQDAIKTIRDRIRANIIAIRLFGDDVGLLFRLQWRILRGTVVFLRYALTPLLITLVPLVLILIQLDLRYTTRPLEPGERTVVKVRLADPSALRDPIELEAPAGVVVETPGVHVAELSEVAWRIRADAPGTYELGVKVGGQTVTKQLLVGSQAGYPSKMRTGGPLTERLLHPGEAPVDAGAVRSVEVRYPPLPLTLFGWDVNWLVAFLVVSLVAGFAFKGVLGVEI